MNFKKDKAFVKDSLLDFKGVNPEDVLITSSVTIAAVFSGKVSTSVIPYIALQLYRKGLITYHEKTTLDKNKDVYDLLDFFMEKGKRAEDIKELLNILVNDKGRLGLRQSIENVIEELYGEINSEENGSVYYSVDRRNSTYEYVKIQLSNGRRNKDTSPDTRRTTNCQIIILSNFIVILTLASITIVILFFTTPQYIEMTGVSCKDLKLKYNFNKSGEYLIKPDVHAKNCKEIKIFCDMMFDGGGWSVIQRRGVRNIPKAERENFNRNWTEYENGFGSVLDDHWIGLKNIHFLTNQNNCGNELLVILTKWDGKMKYARYSNFMMNGSEDFYRLRISGYQGNTTFMIGEKYGNMIFNNNSRFSTFDKENNDYNCVARKGGAWWHVGRACTQVNLNGEYSEDGGMGKEKDSKGIYWWNKYTRSFYSYMKTEMKIRSKC